MTRDLRRLSSLFVHDVAIDWLYAPSDRHRLKSRSRLSVVGGLMHDAISPDDVTTSSCVRHLKRSPRFLFIGESNE